MICWIFDSWEVFWCQLWILCAFKKYFCSEWIWINRLVHAFFFNACMCLILLTNQYGTSFSFVNTLLFASDNITWIPQKPFFIALRTERSLFHSLVVIPSFFYLLNTIWEIRFRLHATNKRKIDSILMPNRFASLLFSVANWLKWIVFRPFIVLPMFLLLTFPFTSF